MFINIYNSGQPTILIIAMIIIIMIIIVIITTLTLTIEAVSSSLAPA